MTFELTLEEKGVSHRKSHGKGSPGRRHNRCQGLELGESLMCLKNRKEVIRLGCGEQKGKG